MGLVQVNEDGKVETLPKGGALVEVPDNASWRRLSERLEKLLHVR